MKDNTYVLLVGSVGLTLVVMFAPDQSTRTVAVGGLLGLVAGHLNGTQRSKQDAPS